MKRAVTPNETTQAQALLEELLETPAAPTVPTSLVAEVVDDRHPTLLGRVLLRWTVGAQRRERWVPTLHGLPVRRGDRVLLQQPANCCEPVVIGVLDGYATRSDEVAKDAARIELRPDEAVRLCDHRGRPLLELREGERGPVVQLCSPDLELAIPGDLDLRAKSVRVHAEDGSATVTAERDVVLRGETVHLN